jgi:hypothetical protein
MKVPGIRLYNLQELLLFIKNIYIDALRRLRDEVRRKYSEKGDQRLVSHSRQCSYTPVGLCQDFPNKE